MTTSIEHLTGIRREDGITGKFQTRLSLFERAVRIDPANEVYQAWAKEHSVDPKSGTIVTSIDNLEAKKQRFSNLSKQLREFAGKEKKGSEVKTDLPDNLRAVLKAAAEDTTASAEPLRILLVTSLKRIPHFEIREAFPDLKVHTTVAAPDTDYAQSCNTEIRIIKPEISNELVYESEWQKGKYDLVALNPAIQYHSQAELKELIEEIAITGAQHVVASDLLPNKLKGLPTYWQVQPYSGGIIPIRMLGEGELQRQMNDVGYELVAESKAPISYPVDKRSGIPAQNPTVDNYTFVRRFDPV